MSSASIGHSIRCIHLPRVNNVYVDLLQKSLEDEGVHVEFLRELPTLRELFRQRENPPLYHFHWLNVLYHQTAHTFPIHFARFYFKLTLMRRWGFPIVWTMHNVWPHDPQRKFLAVWAQGLMARAADAITVHCKRGKVAFEDLYGPHSGLTIIPPGNYAPLHSMPPPKGECRERLGLPKDDFLFLCFGYLRRYKGIDELMTVLPRLRKEHVSLLLAGNAFDRSMRTYLQRVQRDTSNLHVHQRFIPEGEVRYYYGAADAVVAPFNAILNSASVMMALTMGKPVIAPAIGCIPEQVPPDAGILYEPDVPDALYEAMKRIQRLDLSEMGENARRSAESFRWEDVGRAHRELYDRVITRDS